MYCIIRSGGASGGGPRGALGDAFIRGRAADAEQPVWDVKMFMCPVGFSQPGPGGMQDPRRGREDERRASEDERRGREGGRQQGMGGEWDEGKNEDWGSLEDGSWEGMPQPGQGMGGGELADFFVVFFCYLLKFTIFS